MTNECVHANAADDSQGAICSDLTVNLTEATESWLCELTASLENSRLQPDISTVFPGNGVDARKVKRFTRRILHGRLTNRADIGLSIGALAFSPCLSNT